ncbi:hypothetical protein PR048_002054 [Dryococelus australis]|uniref:Uncharacterized protein n=1 Tax=Dryococelus australis TaxID=614101 RepID=A0ABQ9IKI8_9NEOP|nr:hypothetical protein PR048_002054 [Dryococelus australis]
MSDILNFVEWWPTMYKRDGVAKTAKVLFQPGSFMHIKYSSENQGTVTTSGIYGWIGAPHFQFEAETQC